MLASPLLHSRPTQKASSPTPTLPNSWPVGSTTRMMLVLLLIPPRRNRTLIRPRAPAFPRYLAGSGKGTVCDCAYACLMRPMQITSSRLSLTICTSSSSPQSGQQCTNGKLAQWYNLLMVTPYRTALCLGTLEQGCLLLLTLNRRLSSEWRLLLQSSRLRSNKCTPGY